MLEKLGDFKLNNWSSHLFIVLAVVINATYKFSDLHSLTHKKHELSLMLEADVGDTTP